VPSLAGHRLRQRDAEFVPEPKPFVIVAEVEVTRFGRDRHECDQGIVVRLDEVRFPTGIYPPGRVTARCLLARHPVPRSPLRHGSEP